jgi:hypothetical protein
MAGEKRAQAQLIWTLEYYAWAKRIEKKNRVITRMSIRHTPRAGVLDIYVEVWTVVDNKPYQRLVREGFDYPNSLASSFDVQVMALLSAVEARFDEALKVWSQQEHML